MANAVEEGRDADGWETSPDIQEWNINRCAEIATNREEWRTIVSNVVSDKEQR